MPFPEPAATVREWLLDCGVPAITTQLDPASLPQLVIVAAGWTIDQQPDGRPHPTFRHLNAAIVAHGHGGDRPNFQEAWTALEPVIDATATPTVWHNAAGTVSVTNCTNIVTSRSVDPTVGTATVTVSLTLTVRRTVAPL